MTKLSLSKKDINHSNPAFNVGNIINNKHHKRIKHKISFIDISIPYEHKITLITFYAPAPKSRLRNKNIFSKIKMPILC